MAIDSVRRSLAPDLDTPAAARRALDGFRGQLEEDVIERSALVVTEVVTNSVTHAGLTAAQPIDLNIQVLPGCLRIEVTDEGTAGFDPVVAPPYPGQSSGLGLWMVDQLTDRWGVDFSRSTRVWGEFDLDIQVLPACLRIEVTDEGSAGFDLVVTLPCPGQNSGRGPWTPISPAR